MVVERKVTNLTLDDCERRKFDINDDNEVIVRTSAEGEFSSSGLKNGFKITTIEITDSASKLPTTPFSDRNALSVHNKSSTDILYLGPDNTVTADTVVGVTSGWEVPVNNKVNFDIKDIDPQSVNINIWAIAPTGKTITVKILELA